MAIPPKDSQAIREALTRFDQDLRSSEQWKNWEQNGTYKWAIIDDGRRYPVKQILSMATGLSKRSFSGGPEANTYLTSRGFNVSRIHQDSDTDIREHKTSWRDIFRSEPQSLSAQTKSSGPPLTGSVILYVRFLSSSHALT